jgi:hypothetical protein
MSHRSEGDACRTALTGRLYAAGGLADSAGLRPLLALDRGAHCPICRPEEMQPWRAASFSAPSASALHARRDACSASSDAPVDPEVSVEAGDLERGARLECPFPPGWNPPCLVCPSASAHFDQARRATVESMNALHPRSGRRPPRPAVRRLDLPQRRAHLVGPLERVELAAETCTIAMPCPSTLDPTAFRRLCRMAWGRASPTIGRSGQSTRPSSFVARLSAAAERGPGRIGRASRIRPPRSTLRSARRAKAR